MNLKSIPLDEDLLKVLFEELLLQSKDAMAEMLVVLPTARLGMYLKAALAKKIGAFLAPTMVNWHQMLGLLWDQESEERIVSPEIAEYLLKSTIRTMKVKNIAAYHAHELLQLYNDIENAGGTGRYIERFRREVLPTLDFASEHRLLLEVRLKEIEDLKEEFYKKLQSIHLITKSRWESFAADSIIKKLKSEVKLKYSKIYIAGLTTMNSVQLELLNELVQKNYVKTILSKTPTLHNLAKFNPLGEIHRALSIDKKNSSFTNDYESKLATVDHCITKINVIEFETPFLEVCSILSEIRKLIQTRSVHPSKIAILLTNEAEYGSYLREMTQDFEFSTNFAIANAFVDSPLGQIFVAINRLISEELSCESILSFLTHPLLIKQMQLRENLEGRENTSPTDFNLRLVQAACEIEPPEANENLRIYADRLFRKANIEFNPKSKEVWEEFVRAFDEPGQANSRWIALIDKFLKDFALESLAETLPKEKTKGLYLSANQAFQELLEQFMSLQYVWPQKLRFSEFLLDFFEQLFKKEIRSVGDPLAGLQVLSLEESRYVPFEYIYVLGCSEGLFPKALPQDVLLSDSLKSLMGLKGWGYLEAMEDTTFALLRHRGARLCLSYAKNIGSRSYMRSRYLDQLIFDGQAAFSKSSNSLVEVLSQSEIIDLADHKSVQKVKQKECSNLVCSSYIEFAKKMPVSALENLLRCPQKFLLQRLSVKSQQLPRFDDQKRLGSVLHKILELFFNGGIFRQKTFLALNYLESEERLLQHLQEICDSILPIHQQKSALGYHLKYYSWPRFIQQIYPILTKMRIESKNSYFVAEKKFPPSEQQFRVKITHDQEVELWGRIDLLIESKDWRILVDFKQRSGASSQDKKYKISSQLPIYALSQAAENGIKKTILSYFNLLPSEWEFFSFQEGADDLAKELGIVRTKPTKNKEFTYIYENLLNIARTRINDLSPDGFGFKADPTNCGFCDLMGVCRRDDPRYSRTIWQQNRLESI